jgi:hypothetical protein
MRRTFSAWLVILAILSAVWLPAAGAANFDQTGFEDFTQGTSGAPVPGWQGTPASQESINLYYSWDDSYAYISMTAKAGEAGIGYVTSPWVTRNVDVDNTLEIRVQNLTYQTSTSWIARILVDSGTEQPPTPKNLLVNYDLAGNSGIFTFALNGPSTGLSGNARFQVQIEGKLNTPNALTGYILLDYLRIYSSATYNSQEYLQTGSKKHYLDLWKENFAGGVSGTSVDKWWDDNDDNTEDADILYEPDGAKVRMLPITAPSPSHSFKVISPGLYWDPVQYPLVRGSIPAMSPHTRCVVGVLEIGRTDNNPWQSIVIGYIDHPGDWVLDIRNIPQWLWPKERMLALEFFIEGAQPNVYYPGTFYDLAYAAVSKELVPVPLSSQVRTYATPNPFYPRRGQSATIQLSLPDPTADYTIRLYNLKGRPVRYLQHENIWDGRDESGNNCEGGVYLYQLENNGQRSTGQITLVR